MLTPVDQPLDKLDDLQKDEMYVGLLYNTLVSDRLHIIFLVKICEVRFIRSYQIILLTYTGLVGWIDHFSNKYIICGKLVENDAV